MRKLTRRAILLMLLMSVNVAFWNESVGASSYKDLMDAQNKRNEAKADIESAKDDVEELNKDRATTQKYLTQLNDELKNASGDLYNIEQLMAEKTAEIATIQTRLEEAKKAEKEQYAAMKQRIKFLYEQGDVAYVQLFFESKSFADFLNKSEYAEQVSAYDRKKLEEYVKLQESIEDDEISLGDEIAALASLQGEAESRKDEVYALVEETSKSMAEYMSQISQREQELIEYERKLEQSESNITTIREQLEAENAITRQANLEGFQDLSSITFGKGDLDLMAAIIECEAGGEPYVGKVAVGNVVLNRVKSARFPNTVLEVLYQNRQFSPVGSGRFAIVLARGANAECYKAAQDAMGGSAPVGNLLFFRTPIPGLTGLQIGGHIFH